MPDTIETFRPLEDVEKMRLSAEASKFNAETQKAIFEGQLFEAQVAEANVRVLIAEEERKQFVLNTEAGRIHVEEAQRRERDILATNSNHKVYTFNGDVDRDSAKRCTDQLTNWSRNSPECDIELQINSPGGNIVHGLALFDFLLELRRKGHHLTTYAFGYAASMGGVLLQAGTKRIMAPHSHLLIHQGSMGAGGDFSAVEDQVAFMKMLHEQILNIFVERSKKNAAYIKKNWDRKDWWLSADQSLALGFCDEVRTLVQAPDAGDE